MAYISGLHHYFDMLIKVETLYQDKRFMERNVILFRLSLQATSNISNIVQFADRPKRDGTRLKKIGTKDVTD